MTKPQAARKVAEAKALVKSALDRLPDSVDDRTRTDLTIAIRILTGVATELVADARVRPFGFVPTGQRE